MRAAPGETQVCSAFLLTLILSLAACDSGRGASPEDVETVDTVEVEASRTTLEPPADGAAVLESETLSIEGETEVIRVQAVVSPPSFPLAFTTVAPNDMLVDFLSSGEGDAVRFEAAFGGVHVPEAALVMMVLPAGTTAEDARDWVAEIAGGTPREPESDRPSWMAESYTIRGELSGFAALGERESRWFYFLASYPPEFGDGIGPRIDLILSRWRWADGSGLSTVR